MPTGPPSLHLIGERLIAGRFARENPASRGCHSPKSAPITLLDAAESLIYLNLMTGLGGIFGKNDSGLIIQQFIKLAVSAED